MSKYTVDDEENLTTDAVPDPPRKYIDKEVLIINDPDEDLKRGSRQINNSDSDTEKEPEQKNSVRFPINTKKKISSGNIPKSRKKSPKPAHACTKVINVLNSSGVHIGAVNNYNLYSESQKGQKNNNQKENTVRNAAVDRIIQSEELVRPEHINFVSTHLGEGWRDVGDILGYSKGQMDHFYTDYKDIGHKEVVYRMLLDWMQVKPDDSKIGILAAALWDSNQKDLVYRWSKTF